MGFIGTIFGTPLGWVMWACYSLVKNYGLALILITIIAKLCMFPLGIKQQKTMTRMAKFKPKIDAINKRFATNPQRRQEETMKLYQEEGYNPMGGCLPMLIQFPILFGLIDVVYKPLTHILHLSSDVIAQATKIAQDLSILTANPGYNAQIEIVNAIHKNPDSFSALGADVINKMQTVDLNFLGLNLGEKPELGLNLLMIIPILSGVTSILVSLLSSKFNASGQEMTGMSKWMMLIMPLFSLIFTFQVPAGVGLYWTVSNILSGVQVLVLNKMYNPKIIAQQAALEWEEEKKKKKKIITTATDETGKTTKQEVSLSKKELDRKRLAEARRRDAEKYGDTYKEVTDEDLQ